MFSAAVRWLLPWLCGWAVWITPATAAADAARGWYIGVSAGSTTPKATNFASAESWNYSAGYRFDNLSSELTYAYLGRFRHDSSAATDVRVWGVSLSAVPRYEVNSWLELETLLGVHRWRANSQLLGTHFGSDEGSDATFGAGIWLNIRGSLIKDGVAISLRWQRYNNVSGTDLSQYALGVHYVFH